MAKIKKIKVSIERTVNIGNFENMKPHAEIEIELNDGDNYKEIYDKAFRIVGSEVNQLAEKIKKKYNDQ